MKHLEPNSNPTLKKTDFFLFLRYLHGLKTKREKKGNSMQEDDEFPNWNKILTLWLPSGRGQRDHHHARPLPHRFTAQKLNHSGMEFIPIPWPLKYIEYIQNHCNNRLHNVNTNLTLLRCVTDDILVWFWTKWQLSFPLTVFWHLLWVYLDWFECRCNYCNDYSLFVVCCNSLVYHFGINKVCLLTSGKGSSVSQASPKDILLPRCSVLRGPHWLLIMTILKKEMSSFFLYWNRFISKKWICGSWQIHRLKHCTHPCARHSHLFTSCCALTC